VCKHIGTFKSIPATGKTITFIGTANIIVEQGKILKYYLKNDVKSIVEQLLDSNKSKCNIVEDKPILNNQHEAFFDSVLSKFTTNNINISIRQLECLSLWIGGKSDSEIGEIIGLSKRTIHYHQDRIKLIFDVDTKNNLVDKIKSLMLEHILLECAYLLIKSKLSIITNNTFIEHEQELPA